MLCKVGDVPNGTVIETYHYNSPSGNFYRVGDICFPDHRYGYCRFTGRRVTLWAWNDCVMFNEEEVALLGGF